MRETGDVSLLQVTAEDDSTLVVVLNGKFDWFLTEVCTAPATMPLRQDLLQEETAAADGETAEAAAEPAEAGPLVERPYGPCDQRAVSGERV